MTLTMKTNLFTHQHAMTLFNHELAVEYHFENDKIKITEIMFKHYKNHNLVHFMSGKIFKLIVEMILLWLILKWIWNVKSTLKIIELPRKLKLFLVFSININLLKNR